MANNNDYNRFNTINDFLWCMESGGEVEFEWQNVFYSITHTTDGKISISEANNQESELIYNSPDDVLEYILKTNEKLHDVITKISNISRTI